MATRKEFYDMGKANAVMAFDQAPGEYGGDYDAAHESYWQNVSDTALEMGARPGSKNWDAANEGFMETWSSLFATLKKRKAARRRQRASTRKRILGR